ncbi:MAG: hypothetical protein ACM34I_02525 [bacterium]
MAKKFITRRFLIILCLAAGLWMAPWVLHSVRHQTIQTDCLIGMSLASAEDAKGDESPYGGSKSGAYGEKRTIRTKEEAEKVLREYFAKKNVTIGRISEKELYFEAEILDKNNKVIDTVIVNKRTGRIRSIF